MPKVTVDLPEIKGYEYTGEYRPPVNEYHAWTGDPTQVVIGTSQECCFILRKLKERRPINGDDLMRLMKGETLALLDGGSTGYELKLTSSLKCQGVSVCGQKFESVTLAALLASTVEVE